MMRPVKRALLAAVLAASGAAVEASFRHSFQEPKLQGSAEWVSISEDKQFKPASPATLTKSKAQQLRRLQQRFLADEASSSGAEVAGYASQFADSSETFYDEYAQAWRMLGVYVDCTAVQNNRRRLEEQEQKEGEEGDGADQQQEEEQQEQQQEEEQQAEQQAEEEDTYCNRYILWAAYVDLDYEGGGIGEYQFWDADSEEWDSSGCAEASDENSEPPRCAKMDCHLQNTHFSLLGYFKQYDYDDWMEQLFKHEAYCIWSYDEYEFMNNYRQWWPEGCTDTGVSVNDDTYLYLDIKPIRGGKMGLGLYTDESCAHEYTGSAYTIGDIIGAGDGDNDIQSLESHLDMWNSAMSVFRTCQPCKAYTPGSKDTNYQCDDVAGAQDVNQCMKFKSNTGMAVASYRDIRLASNQGDLVNKPAYSHITSVGALSFWDEWGFFIIACIIFLIGLCAVCWAARPPRVVKSESSRSARRGGIDDHNTASSSPLVSEKH